jgi:hypothetical protein
MARRRRGERGVSLPNPRQRGRPLPAASHSGPQPAAPVLRARSRWDSVLATTQAACRTSAWSGGNVDAGRPCSPGLQGYWLRHGGSLPSRSHLPSTEADEGLQARRRSNNQGSAMSTALIYGRADEGTHRGAL